MKVNNPNIINFPIKAINEKHFEHICNYCIRNNIFWNKDVPKRFKYPVEILLIETGFRKFMAFGWEEPINIT